MKEMEKVVGQAEKDLEMARLRLEVSYFLKIVKIRKLILETYECRVKSLLIQMMG